MEQKFYMHKDGFIYSGDMTEGAREATPEEINNHLNPKKTQAELQKQLTDAVQAYMDKTAQSKGYDDLVSAVSYAAIPAEPKFQTEGLAFGEWRSKVWAYCYAQLDAVKNGEREVPTAEKLITELPLLVLP